MLPAVSGSPVAAGEAVRFTVADPGRALAGVRLYQELSRPYDGPEMAWEHGIWTVAVATRGASRVEYLLSIRHPDGRVDTGPDPANPLRAPGPFGDKSVVELPAYRPPAWLRDACPPERPGSRREVFFPSPKLGHDVRAVLWTSAGASARDRLPLLVAHDGPEYAEFAGLLDYLDSASAAGIVPPMHAALLAPLDRDEEYSASAVYSDALASDLLPAIGGRLAVASRRRPRVGVGASLGAVAMLHAERRHPDLFGGLLLQSGSFFQRRTDPMEAGFRRFARIERFVRGVLAEPGPAPTPAVVRMTCGTVEENLANNEVMAAALVRQGYSVTLGHLPDGHNWVSWRDALDLHLGPLLAGLWAQPVSGG